MKEFKLISMTDFIHWIGNREEHESYEKDLALIYNYVTFLKQPLKLEMFVPCDDEGNVLLESLDYDEKLCNYCPLDKKGVYGVDGGYKAGCEGSRCDDARENYNIEYEQANEKVLFEGFEIGKYGNGSLYLKGCHNNYTIINGEIYDDNENAAPQKTKDTIEELLYMNNGIKLTPTAIKQIGL